VSTNPASGSAASWTNAGMAILKNSRVSFCFWACMIVSLVSLLLVGSSLLFV